MSLFVQNITLGISNSDYLVEKVTLPQLNKGKIDIMVKPGTVAVIDGVKYKGTKDPYKLSREALGTKKATPEAYLLPDKMFDSISIPFFGGQHVVSISSLTTAKATFSIVGTATVEIADHKELAKYFERTITREDLVNELTATVKPHLSNEVNAAASKYITPETTEVTLRVALDNVAQDVMKSRKTASALFNMGLMISARGITMHLNALDDAEDKLRVINEALTCKALSSLDNDLLDRQERELAAARQHEIDKIRAERTDLRESTETKNINTNTNGNGKVIINNGSPAAPQPQKRFCTQCGAEIQNSSARFCPLCGAKL